MTWFQRVGSLIYKVYCCTLAPLVRWVFFQDLILYTENFGHCTWQGHRIWQNLFDFCVIQETLWEVKPHLLIECGTNRGGSAFFYAQFFDLMQQGKVVTIDVEKLHKLDHPRITFLQGSSVDPNIVAQVEAMVKATQGPVMVILDSDHTKMHVLAELECYARFVTQGSYCLVQDGVIDKLFIFQHGRPGPLRAIKAFLPHHPEFVVDEAKTKKFPLTHHPMGWLKRVSVATP